MASAEGHASTSTVNQRTTKGSPGAALDGEKEIHEEYARKIRNKAFTYAGCGLIALVCLNTLIISWTLRTTLSIVSTVLLGYFLRGALFDTSQDFSWYISEQRRAPLLHPPVDQTGSKEPSTTFEGAEWLNGLLDVAWPVIDQQLFATAMDLIEDEMKAMTPGIVQMVRVTSLEQGAHPVRVLGMRILPSSATQSSFVPPPASSGSNHSDASRSDQTNGNAATLSSWADPSIPQPAPFAADQDEQRTGEERTQGQGEGEGAQGPYVEMEVEFGYRRGVSRGAAGDQDGDVAKESIAPEEADKNIHFVAYLTMGIPKLTGFPIPILFAVQSVRGKARVRIQVIPEPPFVKTVVFGFEGLPQVELNAYPLRGPVDVMSIPLINNYAQSAIEAVLNKFVLPRHYALDLRKFMLGGDVPVKTRTIGLVVVVLHKASHLPAADPRLTTLRNRGGKSDPYVQVAWSAIGNSLYRTKVRRNTPENGEAVWEEMCFIRCPREPIEDNARLNLSVWDHDRAKSNDMIGYTEISIRDLHDTPGNWRRETKRLNVNKNATERHSVSADENGRVQPATIDFSIAYFPLLEKAQQEGKDKRTAPEESGEDAKDDPFSPEVLEQRGTESDDLHEQRKGARMDSIKEMMDGRHPPPLSHRSGILSFMIHSVADIHLEKGAGPIKAAARRLKPGSQTKVMRKAELPSTYVRAFWNDLCIYRTRMTPFSNSPNFNGGSETFIRDWTLANVTFAVMDYRDRGPGETDHDVLVGYVSLNLRDVFQEHSQVSKWYPISGGAGSGRLRLSLLFKPLAIHLHPSLREWSVGALQITSASLTGLGERNFTGALRINIEDGASGTRPLLDRQDTSADQGGDALNFDFSTSGPLVLPVLSRTTPVRITLVGFGASSVKSSRKAVAEGVFTLNQVTRDPTDNVITVELDRNGPPPLPCPYPLPQLQIDDEVPPDETTTPADGASRSNAEKLVLTLHARWRPGMSTTHADLVMATSSSARAAYELYLYKKDRGESTLAKQPRIASTSETTSDDYGGDSSLDWEDDDEEGEEGQVEEIENRKDGTRTRKGGTFRWIKHGAKVAKSRLQGIRQHQLSEMAPETELQSAL
ncbi:hypothetical protein RHOSPDRAFT_27740 [Rhodotorula sp. JG-1b]|nr:hypothetical protein RHOSPDRAFT_27740 [Rhodotorula sp. JG-1b]